MPALDFDALGAQYREAKDAIGIHVRRLRDDQEALTALVPGPVDLDKLPPQARDRITDARSKVTKAAADVEWCRAVTVAAGEEFKGETFAVVVARNATHGNLKARAKAQGDPPANPLAGEFA